MHQLVSYVRKRDPRMVVIEEAKEANILYMYKINGCGVSYEDRRRSESKRILFQKIAQDFTQNVIYEYL